MARRKNKELVGTLVDNIEVLNLFKKNGRWFFNCKCFCGKVFDIRTDALGMSSSTSSCGCLTGKLIVEKTAAKDGSQQLNSLYRSYKDNAKKRKLSFNISKEIFYKLIAGNCTYCNASPSLEWISNRSRKNYFTEPLLYNGIDRINSHIGYIDANIATCRYICNTGKMDFDYDAFIEYLDRLAAFNAK